MGIAGSQQALFIVWTKKETFSEFVLFDKKLWQNVRTSLEVFFKSYVIPALLFLKPIVMCAKCSKVLLEEREIETKDQSAENSIQCDSCACWFHYRCQNIQPNDFSAGQDLEWPDCLVSTTI